MEQPKDYVIPKERIEKSISQKKIDRLVWMVFGSFILGFLAGSMIW